MPICLPAPFRPRTLSGETCGAPLCWRATRTHTFPQQGWYANSKSVGLRRHFGAPRTHPQRHTFNTCREQGCLAPIVIAPVKLALSCGVFEANVMLRNEVHEFQCGVGDNIIRIYAAFVVDPFSAKSPDHLNASA